VPFETFVERLPAGAKALVVQNYRQGSYVVASRSFDFHPCQTERTVAGYVNNRLLGMGELRAHRRRRGPAHGAGSAETDEAVGETTPRNGARHRCG
jgi:hypothetical protein